MKSTEFFDFLRDVRRSAGAPGFLQKYCVLLQKLCLAKNCVIVELEQEQEYRLKSAVIPDDQLFLEQATSLLASHQQQISEQGFATRQCTDQEGKLRIVAVCTLVAQPLLLAFFDIPSRESSRINELILRVRLVADLADASFAPSTLLSSGEEEPGVSPVSTDLLRILELAAETMSEKHFGAAVLILVNGLATLLGSVQVVLGWSVKGYARIEAISHISHFDLKTEQATLLQNACEECLDQERKLIYPDDLDTGHILLAHRQLQRELGSGRIISIPLRIASRPFDAVLLIAEQDGEIHPQTLASIEAGAGLMLPWLVERRSKDRWWGARLADWSADTLGKFLGPEHLWQKAAALVACAMLIYICFGEWAFRLEAGAEMVTDHTRQIGAPFDGYVDQVFYTLGDSVDHHTTLALLDVQDLYLQESELRAEIRRISADSDKARAQNNLADMEIANARLTQSEARLQRVLFQRNQAEITAPFSGIVVEGERRELLGTPVRQGDPLFKLARIEDLYAQLYLPEAMIRYLEEGARGEIALITQPDLHIPFLITKIIPMAQVKGQQGNHFILEATLEQAPESWWRPGMTGIAKIDAGRRPIIWIWTYRLIDTLRMKLWL